MEIIRFDVLVFAWLAVAYLRDVAQLPKAPAQVLQGVLLGLMLFALLLPVLSPHALR